MNRRSFLGFLAVAPVVPLVAATTRPEDRQPPIRGGTPVTMTVTDSFGRTDRTLSLVCFMKAKHGLPSKFHFGDREWELTSAHTQRHGWFEVHARAIDESVWATA